MVVSQVNASLIKPLTKTFLSVDDLRCLSKFEEYLRKANYSLVMGISLEEVTSKVQKKEISYEDFRLWLNKNLDSDNARNTLTVLAREDNHKTIGLIVGELIDLVNNVKQSRISEEEYNFYHPLFESFMKVL